jgi:CRISPR-associated protein (TIGR02710 family)
MNTGREDPENRVLLLTVGTGDIDELEATLLAPLEKSIREGEWRRVILLPSQVTQENAEVLRKRLAGTVLEVRPLPAAEAENDADACFAHFDAVLEQVLEGGASASGVVLDFTRGTKAMSAALVLAGIARDVPRLRYIYGQRDERGMVKPSSEHIGDINARHATTRRDLSRASDFLRQGQFRAAAALFPPLDHPTLGLYPAPLRPEVAGLRWCAEFWGAWDRFDYSLAASLAGKRPAAPPASGSPFRPSDAQVRFLARLATPLPEEPEARADPLRDLCADVLENARRRLLWGHFEDAMIRCYRVLELVGQVRLFEQGLDSEDIDPQHPGFQRWLTYKEKQGRPVRPDDKGKFTLARQNVASLLKRMRDPLAPDLLDEKRYRDLPRSRNRSVLIHGYHARVAGNPNAVRNMLDQLEGLLTRDHPDNPERLAAARFGFAQTPREHKT